MLNGCWFSILWALIWLFLQAFLYSYILYHLALCIESPCTCHLSCMCRMSNDVLIRARTAHVKTSKPALNFFHIPFIIFLTALVFRKNSTLFFSTQNDFLVFIRNASFAIDFNANHVKAAVEFTAHWSYSCYFLLCVSQSFKVDR